MRGATGPCLEDIPFPAQPCELRAARTRKRLQPACLQHCMAARMKHGRIEDLVARRVVAVGAPQSTSVGLDVSRECG